MLVGEAQSRNIRQLLQLDWEATAFLCPSSRRLINIEINLHLRELAPELWSVPNFSLFSRSKAAAEAFSWTASSAEASSGRVYFSSSAPYSSLIYKTFFIVCHIEVPKRESLTINFMLTTSLQALNRPQIKSNWADELHCSISKLSCTSHRHVEKCISQLFRGSSSNIQSSGIEYLLYQFFVEVLQDRASSRYVTWVQCCYHSCD